MKKILGLLAITLVILVIGLSLLVKASPTLPLTQTINRSGIWLQNATEASWFVWNNNLYYVYTDRDLAGDNDQMKIIQPSFDSNGNITSQTTVSTFGSGYGCQDAYVSGSTLYILATTCRMDNSHNGNSIVMFSSTDLTTWSSPTTVKTMASNTQVYNVSIDYNSTTSKYILAYENKVNSGNFQINFIQSSDLSSWTTTGGTFSGGYANPEIKFVNGVYYMWVGSDLSNGTFVTWMTKSSDLTNWTWSRITTLRPTYEYEDINTTDLDLQEFNGKTYGLYMTGDQSTYMRLSYLTFNGTLTNFINVYQQPN